MKFENHPGSLYYLQYLTPFTMTQAVHTFLIFRHNALTLGETKFITKQSIFDTNPIFTKLTYLLT